MINYVLYLHNNNISLHRKKVNSMTLQIVSPFTLSAFTKGTKLVGMINFHSTSE